MTDIDDQRLWARQAQVTPYAPPAPAPPPPPATPQPQWGAQAPPPPGAQPFSPQAPAARNNAHQAARAHLMRQLYGGLGLLAVGLVITVGGYLWAAQRSAESGQGSSYLVLWGPVVFGLLRTGQAAWGLASLRDARP